MSRCPACHRRIPFAKIFFAVVPSRIKCPTCDTELRGNWFVRTGGVIKAGAAAGATVGALAWVTTEIERPVEQCVAFVGIAVAGFALFGVPMTLATQRAGRYSRR